MKCRKLFSCKIILFKKRNCYASPKTRQDVVELVGANSRGHASIFLGISKTISLFFASELFFSLVIAIMGTLIFLQCKIILKSSTVSPEFEIRIAHSFLDIIPRSPWLASEGWIKKDEEPTEERVEDIFFAIWPLFPIPDRTILPLVLSL